MWWILILLLVMNNGSTCDSLIWVLLLSRFCCGDTDTCPGTCPNPCPNPCPGTPRCGC